MTSTGSRLAFVFGLCLCRRSLSVGGGRREADGGGVARERGKVAKAAAAALLVVVLVLLLLLGRSRLPFLSRSWRHLLKQPALKVGCEPR